MEDLLHQIYFFHHMTNQVKWYSSHKIHNRLLNNHDTGKRYLFFFRSRPNTVLLNTGAGVASPSCEHKYTLNQPNVAWFVGHAVRVWHDDNDDARRQHESSRAAYIGESTFSIHIPFCSSFWSDSKNRKLGCHIICKETRKSGVSRWHWGALDDGWPTGTPLAALWGHTHCTMNAKASSKQGLLTTYIKKKKNKKKKQQKDTFPTT